MRYRECHNSNVKDLVHPRPRDGRTQGQDPFPRARADDSVYDIRVYRLFAIIRHLEEFADRLSKREFDNLLDDAIFGLWLRK